MTLTLTFDLTLKISPKANIFETYKLIKTLIGLGESQPKCEIC